MSGASPSAPNLPLSHQRKPCIPAARHSVVLALACETGLTHIPLLFKTLYIPPRRLCRLSVRSFAALLMRIHTDTALFFA